MLVAVSTRRGHGPIYGALLPDPPKYGWWRVIFGIYNIIHTFIAFPFLILVSFPIKEFEQEIWLVLCLTFYSVYNATSWVATIRCNCFLLYILCFATPVIIIFLFHYAAWRGHFVFKESYEDQIALSILISALIVCTIFRFIVAIEEESQTV